MELCAQRYRSGDLDGPGGSEAAHLLPAASATLDSDDPFGSLDDDWAPRCTGNAETGLVPCLLAERFGETLFELVNARREANGALVRVGQVGLQGRPADGGTDARSVGRLGFGGVDLFEKITVPVEEAAIDVGAAGDAADADLIAFVGGVVECFEYALATAR